MKKSIMLILLVLAVTIAACAQDNLQPVNNRTGGDAEVKIAEDFIMNSPTYAYDGQDLELINNVVQETYPEKHVLTFKFTSTHAGYGDRSDQIIAQVITPHTARIVIVNGEVVNAVLDERWDMLEQIMLSQTGPDSVYVMYAPVQCVDAPWESWYSDGNINYIAEPTDVQLIGDYYANEHNIQVSNIDRVERSEAVCMACESCSRTYYFMAQVSAQDVDIMQEMGWEEPDDSAPVSNK